MKTNKPNWTPLKIYAEYRRWERLIDETDSHLEDCDCNKCMECFGLGALLQTFTQDEHAGAVIEYRKSLEVV